MPYTIGELINIVAPVAARHGIQKVSVFGSYGRKQASIHSDVDLHVEKGDARSLLQLIAFQQDVEEALNLKVDMVTNDISDKRFLDRIKHDEVILYER